MKKRCLALLLAGVLLLTACQPTYDENDLPRNHQAGAERHPR